VAFIGVGGLVVGRCLWFDPCSCTGWGVCFSGVFIGGGNVAISIGAGLHV